MMEFKRDEVREIYDASLIQLNPESPATTAFKSIGMSISNNIVAILSRLILTINLILIGHISYKKKVLYELIITYQVGIFILEILGKYFIIGLIKYLFEEKEEKRELYNLYIRMKTALVILVPVIIGIVSISSYYLIYLLLYKNLAIYDDIIIKEIYFKFMIFTPIIYLFEILFFLNIQFLNYQKQTKEVFFYVFLFIIAHLTLCWILLYIIEIGILGITISYCLNAFLFYLFSNKYIRKFGEGSNQNFFFLIPINENFDGEVFNELKKKSFPSLLNLGEMFIIFFLFFASLFTDKNQLIVNIIYLNFYELIVSINRGFYYTLKRYILTNVESAERRQKYVFIFSSYYLILALSIFIILLIFKNILLDYYILYGWKKPLKIISDKLRIIFPLSFLINSTRLLLSGMIRGMNIPLPIIRKIFYLIIYIILCYFLCFKYELGIFGLWISYLILILFFILECIHKAVIYLPQFFHNYI